MDDDIKAGFDFMHEIGRKKRWSNLEKSTALLQRRGIKFESKNNGIHLIVADVFDFWPSTGKFMHRKTRKDGRGVFNLIKALRLEASHA